MHKKISLIQKESMIHEYGQSVYGLVSFCTEPENKPDAKREEQKGSWKRRKQHSVNSLREVSGEEILVFIADKVSNLLSMEEDLIAGEKLWDQFNAPKLKLNGIFIFDIIKKYSYCGSHFYERQTICCSTLWRFTYQRTSPSNNEMGKRMFRTRIVTDG